MQFKNMKYNKGSLMKAGTTFNFRPYMQQDMQLENLKSQVPVSLGNQYSVTTSSILVTKRTQYNNNVGTNITHISFKNSGTNGYTIYINV